MMGYWQKQTELWVEPINLGRRIPRDHLLRKINKVLDLGFVRREVAGFYGSNGLEGDQILMHEILTASCRADHCARLRRQTPIRETDALTWVR